MYKLIAVLFVIALFSGSCSGPQCKRSVEWAVAGSLAACQLAASQMSDKELGGMTVQEWCDAVGNFEPFFTDYVAEKCLEGRPQL